MKFKALIAGLLFSAVVFTSCANAGEFSDGEIISSGQKREKEAAETFNYSDGATEPPNSYNTYANAAEGLGFKLFRAKYDEYKGKTFAFSPANTVLQLSLLANGASGDAKNEILVGLGALTAEELNTCSSYFKSRMEAVAQPKKSEREDGYNPLKSNHVSLFNNVFVNKDTEITKAFLQTNADFYGINIIRSDFSADDFNQKQSKLFKDYPQFSGSAEIGADKKDKMYTASALSVTDRFLSEDAKSGDAVITSEESYLSTEKAEGILKYTAGNPLKLMVVMPKGKTQLKDYMEYFDVNEYNALLNSQDVKKTVKSELPWFSVDSGSKGKPLSAALQKSGFYTLLSDEAKFKAMNIADKLKLNEMYELEPSLTVSSEGINTQYTQLKAEKSPSKQSGKDTLRFDKPFIFILLDNESSIPVISGIYDSNQD